MLQHVVAVRKFLAANEGRALPGSNDGLGIMQEFLSPAEGCYYRVWFLGEKVQCGVTVRSQGDSSFNTCVGDVCSANRNEIKPWNVPESIAQAVLRVSQFVDANFGSVEFLYPEGFQTRDGRAAENVPMFFDFNLCSTLPDVKKIADPENIWRGRNFYDEMANYILGCG